MVANIVEWNFPHLFTDDFYSQKSIKFDWYQSPHIFVEGAKENG